MSCDGNYLKHFSSVYSPVTRSHIHIHSQGSSHVIDSHVNPFPSLSFSLSLSLSLCILLNVLNLLLPPVLSDITLTLTLCSVDLYSFFGHMKAQRGKRDVAGGSGKTKVHGGQRERRWRSGGLGTWSSLSLSLFFV